MPHSGMTPLSSPPERAIGACSESEPQPRPSGRCPRQESWRPASTMHRARGAGQGVVTVSAQQLGLPPILTAAANSSGGVMGKMIDAQSIVVAGVATGQQGQEGNILRYVFFHSLALAVLVGILIFLQAYVFPGIVPTYTP
jgi:L-lactate permease